MKIFTRFPYLFVVALIVTVKADFKCTLSKVQNNAVDPGFTISDIFPSKFSIKSLISSNGDELVLQEYYRFNISLGPTVADSVIKVLGDRKLSIHNIIGQEKPLLVIEESSSASCTVSDVEEVCENIKMKGLNERYDSSFNLVSPLALIYETISSQIQPTYIGKSSYRSLDVDQWEYCLQHPSGSLKITLYTNSNFKTVSSISSDSKTLPVGMLIEGEVSNRKINQVIHFVDLKRITSDKYFEIPTGIGCNLIDSTKDLPHIPNDGSFHTTYVAENYGTKTIHSLYIDFIPRKYIISMFEFKKESMVKYVLDFTEGVAFVEKFNSESANFQSCDIVNLMKLDLSNSLLSGKGFATPADFFELKSGYYLGKATANGLPVDVYESVLQNSTLSMNGKMYSKMVITSYFTKRTYHHDIPELPDNMVLPVKVKYTGYISRYHRINKEVTVVNFDQIGRSMKVDVTGCYYNGMKMEISFHFAGSYDDKFYFEYSDLIPKNVEKFLEGNYGLSATRIGSITLKRFHNSMGVTFFLNDMQPISRFVNTRGGIPSSEDYAVSASDVNSCAKKCLGSSIECKGFFFCQSKKLLCFLSSNPVLVKHYTSQKAAANLYCPFYKVGFQKNSNGLLESNLDLLKKFRSLAENDNLVIPVSSDQGIVKLKVSDVTQNPDFNNGKADTTSGLMPLNYEMITMDHDLNDGAKILTNTKTSTLQNCVAMCNKDNRCETIAYCSLDQSCKGSSVTIQPHRRNHNHHHQSGNAVNSTTKRKCIILSHSYLMEFIPVGLPDGKIKPDKKITSVKMKEDCAKNCFQNKNFLCQTFEYCPISKACSLYKSRIDAKFQKDDVSWKSCQAMIRSYLSSFREDSFKKESSVIGIKDSTGSSLSNCAALCYKDKDCSQFKYCTNHDSKSGDKHMCFLNTKNHKGKVATVQLNGDAQCLGMNKIAHQLSTTGTTDSSKSPKGSGLGGGAVAGICIGMLILGGVLALLGSILMDKFGKKNSFDNDTTITYTKQDD